jgi:hypothetical protein
MLELRTEFAQEVDLFSWIGCPAFVGQFILQGVFLWSTQEKSAVKHFQFYRFAPIFQISQKCYLRILIENNFINFVLLKNYFLLGAKAIHL